MTVRGCQYFYDGTKTVLDCHDFYVRTSMTVLGCQDFYDGSRLSGFL